MMIRIFIFIACLWMVNAAVHDFKQAHESLSDTEFQNVFHRTRRDVPNYEYISIESKNNYRHKRDLRPVEVTIGNETYQLNLEYALYNAFSYVPAWFAENHNGKPYNYVPIDSERTRIDAALYQDAQNMATFFGYYKDRYIYYDGVFGESDLLKIVRSEPESWVRTPTQKDEKKYYVYAANLTETTAPLYPVKNEASVKLLDKPLETLYPKLLVIVDHNLYKRLGENVEETAKYVSTFWNEVNLKYSTIKSPKIKIVITGLIIEKDHGALSYIHDAENRTIDFLNHYRMLDYQRAYFRDTFAKDLDFENYDATITMTGLQTGISKGAAYIGEICDYDYNVGFVSDDGSYSGLLSGVHELGHLLNMQHDIKNVNGCEGEINKDLSSVMLPTTSNVKGYVWSECSLKYIQLFAWNSEAECLRETRRRRR